MDQIYDCAISDTKAFSQQREGTFKAPSGETATVSGLSSKHNLSVDAATGQPVSSENIHFSVAESLLIAESYPTRDTKDQVVMLNHLITFKDSRGVETQYVVLENYPDQTLGLIVMILGKYSAS